MQKNALLSGTCFYILLLLLLVLRYLPRHFDQPWNASCQSSIIQCNFTCRKQVFLGDQGFPRNAKSGNPSGFGFFFSSFYSQFLFLKPSTYILLFLLLFYRHHSFPSPGVPAKKRGSRPREIKTLHFTEMDKPAPSARGRREGESDWLSGKRSYFGRTCGVFY